MSTLHITNGDCAAATLRTFLSDPVVITADVLHEGPAPLVSLEAWHDIRAREHSRSGAYEYEAVRRGLEASDRAIADAARHDEVVLWFEHDLFDQLLLIRTLGLLGHANARVSLICIDRFPGVDRFIGLGQLSALQLATLVDARRPVTPDQYARASRVWTAFRLENPTALFLTARDAGALPFLRPALLRFFEEYPSTRNGLSRTANAILAALETGPLDADALFRTSQDREAAPFMGDTTVFGIVDEMAAARMPLVSRGGGAFGLTDAGRDVLAGRRDAVALNGIDAWRGGVHLLGAESPWRWDAARETLVSCS